ncbi:MAG: PilC/PilY family type IV pilus protein [Nitrospirota bacterium]|nr:PilC/PilY family type IV pilus protein [Nitrospirota bacterium]MDP2381855.1 PilC/PilY family type IV pilus protein [Nitrospirota bacterium]
MKSRNIATRGTVMLALVGCLLVPGALQAQTMDQYFAVPPFVSDQVAPNILLLLDNSGSMSGLACDNSTPADGDCADAGDKPFANTSTFSGYFDSLLCYTYDSGADARFEPATVKALVSTACSTTQWDGNFLNWATFRRFDALKKSMTGGDCFVARAADGTCPTNGTPALKTVRAQAVGVNVELNDTVYAGGAGATTYLGRIPLADRSGNPGTLYIGVADAYFCIDNDSTFNNNCGDSYSVRRYELKVGYNVEPTGVIQQIGSQARFGLFEFKPTGDGARMLVGLGARQSIAFSGSAVKTFTTNTAAMVDAVQDSFPSTWTPLSESLYETARYIAQINSTYLAGSYAYPIAFAGGISNGVAFGATGAGSIGAPEITALTGSEVCTVGAGYITNACGRDPYFFGSNHTPAWATTSTQVRCCKTFVIIVTDGEPTQDTNIPAGLQDYAHGRHGLHCTGGNATIHAPNGTCNTNSATTAATLLGEHKTDYASTGNHYLDDVAYWAHTNDLRPCTAAGTDGTIPVLNVTGHCLAGLQNLSVYTFFAFGNIAGREILMHTAKLGGFEDSNNNNIPDLVSEWDKVINATGAPGTDGIPDNYFESSNVDDLQDRLMATITAILRKSSSGTAISVLATSASGEGSVYQAYFYTSNVGLGGANVRWTGYTQGLFIDHLGNFREDTDQDGKLVYENDYIIRTSYDNNQASLTYGTVLVDKFVDANGDGSADSTTATISGLGLKDILPFWEGGKQLANLASASRNLLTWVDSNNDGLVQVGEQMQFATANSGTLGQYLRAGAAPYTADNIINFIRGDEVAGLRTRMLEVPLGSGTYKVWKLGDPIHSTPTIVSAPRTNYDLVYGDSSYTAFYQQYQNRREVVYVGANDGMLHAFNGGYYHKSDDPTTATVVEHGWYTKNPTNNSSGRPLGDELWGYVPYQLLPQLQWLTRADYTHVYYVDLKPTVADVRIFTPDADHPNGWGTVLIGGFRMGGSCGGCAAGTGAPPMTVNISGTPRTFYSAYFVLDITNPEVDPKLLWSFSDAGLGLSIGTPSVMRVSPTADAKTDNTNAKWMVLFGSGPNGYAADLPPAPAQVATVYAVDLRVGPGAANSQVTKMAAGSWQSFVGNIAVLDNNFDYRHDVAYFGRTINTGALPWRGKMYRLTTSGCTNAPCSTSTWGVANGASRVPTEMIDTFNDYTALSSTTVNLGPVTTAPSVTIDDANMVWVFFGTGRYLSNSDKTNTEQQYLFGIKDKVMNGGCTQTNAINCNAVNLVNATNAVVCVVCAGGTNQVTDPNNPALTSVTSGATSMAGLVQSRDGWYVKLVTAAGTSAERSVSNPVVIAGAVFFPTLVPTNDFCSSTGTSYLYALYYKTGSAYSSPVIGTSVSGANTISNTRVLMGEGVASQVAIHIDGSGGSCTGGCDGGGKPPIKYCSQMSTGSSECKDASGPNPPWSRYLSWIRQRG